MIIALTLMITLMVMITLTLTLTLTPTANPNPSLLRSQMIVAVSRDKDYSGSSGGSLSDRLRRQGNSG
jgi:hypothetical protein